MKNASEADLLKSCTSVICNSKATLKDCGLGDLFSWFCVNKLS